MSLLDLSTIPTLIIASLAVFRLTYFVSSEAGPFWSAKKFRIFVKKKAPKFSHMDEGVKCSYCMGLEISIVMMAYLLISPRIKLIDNLVIILAVAGLAMVIHQLFVFLRRE